RLLSIRKAPAGSFRRFCQTPRRQPRLRPVRGQCHDQFRHYHQSRRPPDRLSQTVQAFSSSIPHFEFPEWLPPFLLGGRKGILARLVGVGWVSADGHFMLLSLGSSLMVALSS